MSEPVRSDSCCDVSSGVCLMCGAMRARAALKSSSVRVSIGLTLARAEEPGLAEPPGQVSFGVLVDTPTPDAGDRRRSSSSLPKFQIRNSKFKMEGRPTDLEFLNLESWVSVTAPGASP